MIGLPEEVELRTLITVFAGLNGVGKTRLLKHIAANAGDGARFVSLHELCAWIGRLIEERGDLGEAIDEVEPLEIDRDTLDAVRSVVGRKYSSIEWYALDFEGSPFQTIVKDDVIPFFIVEDGAGRYTMLDMGLGELAAHVLLWTLWYLRGEPELLLLLDEPDAYFPPRSGEPLLSHIAAVAATRTQAFVLTSHSREILERVLAQQVDLCYVGRTQDGSLITTEPREVREIVQRVLYPQERLELVAWVEDESAYVLTVALLERIDPDLPLRGAFYWGKGKGDLEGLQKFLPRPASHARSLEFAFFLDGNESLLDQAPEAWPMILLPGGRSPDEVFRDLAPYSVASLAASLGQPQNVVAALLGKIEGLDPHDWTNDFASEAVVDRPGALRALALAALEAPSGEALVDEFRTNLIASGLTVFQHLA